MKAVLTAVAVLMLSMSGYAQTVTKSVNGAIIDCSAFKSDGFTKVKKARTTNGNNDGSTPVKEDHTDIASKVSNEKIYYKLEVCGIDNGSYVITGWRGAVDLCANLTTDGGNWRMPTQRELMLIWVLHPELKKIAGFTPLVASSFWSATQARSETSWSVYFSNGGTVDKFTRTSHLSVRCVRDID